MFYNGLNGKFFKSIGVISMDTYEANIANIKRMAEFRMSHNKLVRVILEADEDTPVNDLDWVGYITGIHDTYLTFTNLYYESWDLNFSVISGFEIVVH
ncbi:hypothetical protein FD17_GL001560 [Lentilactobacillus sunkii DSM 19904]|uniref:Uncharacterized protein n=2 Tax=Lentilactobacillus sunkii TaxID=481719 RepID=A0A0R1KTW2_9LACO|nr:hypothetical protein FD17_GL001560 [Lentilactobacillus sunkii DSM 19904]